MKMRLPRVLRTDATAGPYVGASEASDDRLSSRRELPRVDKAPRFPTSGIVPETRLTTRGWMEERLCARECLIGKMGSSLQWDSIPLGE